MGVNPKKSSDLLTTRLQPLGDRTDALFLLWSRISSISKTNRALVILFNKNESLFANPEHAMNLRVDD